MIKYSFLLSLFIFSYASLLQAGQVVTGNLSVSGNVGIGTSYNTSINSSLIVASGNVGIDSINPGQVVDVQGTIRSTGFIMSGYSPSPTYVLTSLDTTGDTTWAAIPGGSGSVTTGTVGQSAVYTSANTIGSSSIETDTGVNIGIGTFTPAQTLEVDGATYLNAIPSQIFMKSANGSCWVQTVDNNGNGNWNSTGCPQPPNPANNDLIYKGNKLLYQGINLTY